MMTFTTYYLLKNPETMRKLRAEIDQVLGGRPVQCGDFSNLPYLTGQRVSLTSLPDFI